MFSKASLKMGYPPIKAAAMPVTLMCGNGSQRRNQTAAAAKPTKAMRIISDHSNPCSCSEGSEVFGGFISREFEFSSSWEPLVGFFAVQCGGIMQISLP